MKLWLTAFIVFAVAVQGCSKNSVELDKSKAVQFDPAKDANPKLGGPPEGTGPAPMGGKGKGGGLPAAK